MEEETKDLNIRFLSGKEDIKNPIRSLCYRPIKFADIPDSVLKDSFIIDISEHTPVSIDLENENQNLD